MNAILKIICLVILLLSYQLVISKEECVYSEEYKKIQKEVFASIKGDQSPLYLCKESVRSANYWKAIAKCEKVDGGKNIGGGCYHLVGYGKYNDYGITDKHCQVLEIKNIDNVYNEYLSLRIEEENIKQCN